MCKWTITRPRTAGVSSRHTAIVSSLHVHLDHDNCLEVLILRGRSADIRKVADLLIATKGIKHGQLVVTTADVTRLEHSHKHELR